MADPQIPQAFEEATDTPVIIGTDPAVSPLPTLKAGEKDETIPEAAREDVGVQQEGIDFKEVLAGNVPKVGSLNVTPKLLDAAKKNPAIMRRLKAQHTVAGQAAGEDQVVIPMMRQGEFVPSPEIIADPKKLSKAERIAMGRKAVDDLLVQQGIADPLVRQVFVDDFQTGEFYSSLNNRLAQAGEFLGTAIPAASILAWNAAAAGVDAYSKGTDWSAEWGARQNGIKQSFKVMRDTYANINMPTIARSYNDYIAEQLDKKLEDGTITKERYDEAMFITNEQGEKVRREFITEDQAATMMDLAFEELPTTQKYGVIFTETALGLVGPGQTRGVLAMQKFNRLVKKNPAGTEIGDVLRKMDPIEAVDTLKHMGVKTGINRNALSIGVMQQRMDRSLDTLATQIDEAGTKLDMLRINGVSKSSTEYKVAAGDYSNLKQRMLRAKYTARAYPYVKEAGTDALVISAGQLAAREWLPEYTDLSPETSEVIGAIFMVAGGHQATQAIGGKVIQMTSSPRIGGPRVVGSTMEFMANVVTLGALRSATVDSAGKVTPGSPFRLTDQTISDFEKSIGRQLTVDELKGVRAAVKMVNNLTPNEREVVLGALGDYNELRKSIVDSFPEELQGQAGELFSQSFSNATGLTFLSAVNAVNTNRLDIRNLSNLELSSVYKQQMAANKQVEIAEMSINNLENLIQQAGIEDADAVTKFIFANRQALKTYRVNQTKNAEQQLAILQDIRTSMLGDPTFDIPENFVTDLTEADSILRETLGQTVDKREQVRGIMTDLYNGLSERMEIIRGQRGRGKEYYRNIGRAAEDVIDTQIDSIWNMGRAAYDNVRKVSQGQPPIDLSDSVEFLLEQAGETNYQRFFSPEGQFFSGKLGRQNYIVFDEMVTRAMPNIEEFRTFLKTGGTLPDGTEVTGLSQELVDGMTNLELAMELKRIQPDFKPFSQLNAYEVDVMRRTFRDYAYKIQDGALATTYENYASTLDKAIAAQNPEVYGVLKEARATYASEVGDRLRPGSFLYKIDTSRQAQVRTATGDDMFQYAYKGVNPLNLFKGVSNNISKALKGNYDAEGEIVAEVGAIATQFADTVDGRRVFDLTTEAGQAKFAALQNAIGEKVYTDWADAQIKAFERVSGIDAVKQGGYKLDNLAGMSDIHSLMMVDVKTAEGIVKRPLINLESIYSDHRNLNDFVKGSEKARKEYAEFISEFNNVDSKLRVNIQNNIKAQDDAFDELSAFTGGMNADVFYQRFILDSSASEVEYMRDMFVKSQVQTGSRTADEATKVFDAAVGRLTAKGFLNRAGVGPVSGALPAFLHDVPAARQFNTPEVLLDDLRDHREQLEAVLGEKHVSYLENISRFLASSREQSVGLDGKVSGYSLNEGLSRLYNVSRGMVSPLYVTSEFAVRLMARANIDVLELAAGNEQAAEIISKMFLVPETVTLPEMKTLNAALSEFAFTELAREELFAPELNEMFLLPEEEENNEDE
jgi:hypothetical protein